MPDGRSRGLVFFVLIALLAGVGGFGLWQLRKRTGTVGDEVAAERGSGAAGRLVKGTGTSWREDEGPSDLSGALEGVVLDADGAPVDGATVTLGRARARGEETPSSSYFQPRGVATTAGGGRFRVDKLMPGEYSASASREGSGPGQRAQIEVKASETARVEIKLARTGLVLSGRVLDVGGGAIGGARVTAFTRSGTPGRAPVLFFAVSNGEGQYRMTLAKGPLLLRVEAEGYAPFTDSDLLLIRSTTRDVRLVPAGRLAGRVIERGSRQPLADAEVSLTSASRMDFREPRDGKTDGSGQFEFTGLEPGNYEVMARKGMLIGASQSVGLAVAQSVTDLEVEVDRGHVVSGRVKDDRGGGLGGIRVSASRDSPPFGQAARTKSNSDGTYALEGMLPGSYRLNAYEEGYGFSSARARVVQDDLVNVDLVLPIGVKVSGRVVTADGKPVEGARVQAMVETRSGAGGMSTSGDFAATAADGTFELRRIGPGTVRVTAQSDDLGTATVGPEEVKAGEPKVLSLVLKKGGSISGVVRTEDGRPAADVRVGATVRALRVGMPGAQELSGPDGRYRLANLPPGQVTITASRASRTVFGFGTDSPNQKSLSLGDAEDRTGVDLVVGAGGLAVKGTVTTPEGKPVPGAVLTAGLERSGRAFRGSRDLRGYSQLDGQFTIEDLEQGTYTLWAFHPDHPEAEVKGLSGGQSGVKVQFPPDTSVAGLVVAPDGKPIPHYAITVIAGPKPDENPEQRRRRQMDTFDARSQRVQSPSGAFEVRRLAAGTHELQVNAAGGETASQVVTLQAGERKTGVRIQLQPAVRVTGRVLEHGSGKAIPGATVSVMGKGNARAEADVSPDGSFAIEGAPVSETLRLSAQADFTRYVSEWKEIEVKPGQSTIEAGTMKLLPGNMRERMMVMDPSERGDMGTGIVLENGQPVFRNVRPDSPAAKAGLKKGELVTSINGTSTSDLGNGALNYLAAGKPGTTVTLVVETPGGGAPRTVAVTLEPWKPPTPSPPRSN